MTNIDILYSFAMFIYNNNPTSLQVAINKKNIETWAEVTDLEEYINIHEGTGESVLDTVGTSLILRDFEIAVTLKYNKTQVFNYVEVAMQKFIEGVDNKYRNTFPVLALDEFGTFNTTNQQLYIDFTKVEAPYTVFDDDNTKTMFWLVNISHSN